MVTASTRKLYCTQRLQSVSDFTPTMLLSPALPAQSGILGTKLEDVEGIKSIHDFHMSHLFSPWAMLNFVEFFEEGGF